MTYIKPDRFLTLTEFRATGRDVDQATLEEAAGTDLEGGEAGGRVYVGNCYIEGAVDKYCLTIMNESWAASLSTLEALLYAFARTEILPKPADEQAALIEEWRTFCRDEVLPHIDAEELLASDEFMSDAQRAYIREYITRWDHMAQPAPVTDSDRIRALERALARLLDVVDAEHPLRGDGKSRLYWSGAEAQEAAHRVLEGKR